MTFLEILEIWEIKNPEVDFFDGIELHSFIDRDALFDFLLLEYKDMQTVDSDSGLFRRRVKNFFKIHKWNIDKLADTLELKYHTLENVRTHQHILYDNDRTTDTTSTRELTDDETIDRDIVGKDVTDRDVKDKETTEKDYDETQTIDRDIKETEKIGVKDNVDRDWTEKGTDSGTQVNFVSAYNDVPSPEGTPPNVHYNDTEHHRDVENGEYSKSGTEDIIKDTNTDRTDNTEDDTSISKTINDDVTRNDSMSEDITKNTTTADDTIRDETINEDIVKNETMADDIHEDIDKFGHDGGSYQSLIEEERKQAQFNIYKWIAKHFCRELLISLW